MNSPEKKDHQMHILTGIPASPGIVIGRVFLLGVDLLDVPPKVLSVHEVDEEIKRLYCALESAKREIRKIQEKALKTVGEIQAQIFDAHILLLEDPAFINHTVKSIKEKKLNAAHLIGKKAKEIIEQLEMADDSYTRERSIDIRDVGSRVITNLLGNERDFLATLEEEVVVVAKDLAPSDTVSMTREKVSGFATDIGGYTSHTAIMARALEIPAVVGLGHIAGIVNAGDKIIIDGYKGVVIVRPNEETRGKYNDQAQKLLNEYKSHFAMLRSLPSQTTDGYQVEMGANIELAEEILSAKREGAKAIGLYRTEFLFFKYRDIPDEEVQFQQYKDIVQGMAPHPVTLRTIDVGGDKLISESDEVREINPDLGWRGIRFCLQKEEIFLTQLRAILRASIYGKVRIMFPMISGLEEVLQAKAFLEKAKKQLKDRGEPIKPVEVGIMIEIPSAVLTADTLAEEVDFFSIGTNDLIQYTIAVDRRNEKIASMYEPHHPAVLRMIEMTVKQAHQKGIWVGVCGEMASNPISALILLGMGVDELSMSPMHISIIKHVIRSVSFKDIRKNVKKILTMKSSKDIEFFLNNTYNADTLEPFFTKHNI